MQDTLVAILDTLIPPSADGRMPGAGSLGLAETVRAQGADSAEVIDAGLTAAVAAGFSELDLDARVEMLRELDRQQPAFVPTLFGLTCVAYYIHPKVLVGLGLEPRPPHPKGYDMELGDLDGLERVRARGKLYRDAF